MTKVNTVDSKGQASGELEINSKWLEFEKGEQAVHESVVAFLASLRSGSANTKTRSESVVAEESLGVKKVRVMLVLAQHALLFGLVVV